MRIALTGAALSLMLALTIPFVLSHPAHGGVLARTQDSGSTGSLAASAPVPSQAEQGQGNSNVRSNAGSRSHELSRAEAVALVQRRYRARVVRTHLLQGAQGRPFYEFRLLSGGGKVWTVRIDAYSGAELP